MKTTVKRMIWLQFISMALFFISEVYGRRSCLRLLLDVKLPPHTKLASKQHINNHIALVCDKGYYFSKGKNIKDLSCNTLKHLAIDRIPQCKGCGLPPGIRNGTVKFPATSVGSIAVYSCDVGFSLKGTRQQRRCTSNLRWSDGRSRIICHKKNKCRDPGNIKIRNGKVTFSDRSFKEFSTISFQCNDGYELFGDKNIVCLQGQWSLKRRPICNKERFPWPNIPENGRLRGTVKHKGGLDLIFVLQTSSVVRKENFKIAKEFVKKIVEIFGVDPRSNGDGTHIACVNYGTYPRTEFTFNDDSVQSKANALKKIDAIKYVGGATGTRRALDLVRERILPSSTRPNSTKALFLITDGKSNVGGAPWKAAEYLKRKKVYIYVIGVGGKIRHESLTRLASKPLEEHKFEIESYKKLEKIMENIVVRDYSECGISSFKPHDARARIVGGDETSRGRWPWIAHIYYKGKKVCGGTLINKELILTAAHCFGIGRIERTNVQVLFKKKRGTHVYTSVAVYRHHDYHPLTYANDVALVKIKKLKYYTRYHQRVCLPHRVNTAKIIKPGNKMYVVGWGITRRLKPYEFYSIHKKSSKVLKQVKLPFQPNKMCADNVKNKTDQGHENWYFNSTTQFCAGDLTGQNATCKGDSGGPAMMLLKHPVSGKWRWFQVGIISWGYGCAQQGEVAYYTKVSAFLSNWIDEKIRSSSS